MDKRVKKGTGNLKSKPSAMKERLKVQDPEKKEEDSMPKRLSGKKLAPAYRKGADEDFKTYQEWEDTIGDGLDPNRVEKKNKNTLLARMIKKIDPKEEKEMAEEGFEAQNKDWPEY